MKKVSDLLFKIFAYGMILCLFAGGASVIGYIIALFLGGETAASLCTFVFRQYLPVVIRFTSAFCGIGLIGMYCAKQKALTFEADKKTNA